MSSVLPLHHGDVITITSHRLKLFQAYVFELDDEYAESDIPTTLIRSKADCPTVEVGIYGEISVVVPPKGGKGAQHPTFLTVFTQRAQT